MFSGQEQPILEPNYRQKVKGFWKAYVDDWDTVDPEEICYKMSEEDFDARKSEKFVVEGQVK